MKSIMKNLMMVLCLGFIHSLPLWAGAGSSNGGGAYITNPGRAQFLDLVKEATEVPYDQKETKAIETLIRFMDMHQPAFSKATVMQPKVGVSINVKERILSALEQLNFVMTVRPLPELNDAGLIIINWNVNGKVERLAVQDLLTNTVVVNKQLFLSLVEEDEKEEKPVAAFFLHEALIRIYFEGTGSLLESTELIGNIVNITFGKDKLVKKFTPKSLALGLTRAGIPTTPEDRAGMKAIAADYLNQLMIADRSNQLSEFFVFFHQDGKVVGLVQETHFQEKVNLPFDRVLTFTSANRIGFGTLSLIYYAGAAVPDQVSIIYNSNTGDAPVKATNILKQTSAVQKSTSFSLWKR